MIVSCNTCKYGERNNHKKQPCSLVFPEKYKNICGSCNMQEEEENKQMHKEQIEKIEVNNVCHEWCKNCNAEVSLKKEFKAQICPTCVELSILENTTQTKISTIYKNLKDLLQYKNEKYGDSALNPFNLFSKLTGEEALKIRIDDKISRIKNSQELRKNDVYEKRQNLNILINKEILNVI